MSGFKQTSSIFGNAWHKSPNVRVTVESVIESTTKPDIGPTKEQGRDEMAAAIRRRHRPRIRKDSDGFWRFYCPHLGRAQAYKTWEVAFDNAFHCAVSHPKVMAYDAF